MRSHFNAKRNRRRKYSRYFNPRRNGNRNGNRSRESHRGHRLDLDLRNGLRFHLELGSGFLRAFLLFCWRHVTLLLFYYKLIYPKSAP
jgi:hypothetical protein